ncbi:unnamed protein product [Rotaria magnacalcarata]|uniref:Uncharacterized protein n=1 Tax=Rotaria magnacalcarata TaxID=392030 RepID=A0A815FWG0_9BILA|nr:unnamed protein product [Rotaria magnacalcarata]
MEIQSSLVTSVAVESQGGENRDIGICFSTDGDSVEFGDFHDPGDSSQPFWPGPPINPSVVNATTSGKPMTVRAQAEVRRKRKTEIAPTALTIVEKSVQKAMKYMRKEFPCEFMEHRKTTFAHSLPGQACYFKGHWCLNTWDEKARYLTFDDIPWDDFNDESYPNKKNLLSANGKTGVADKYKGSSTINVTMPSIVLLNPGGTGSLTRTPIIAEEKDDADYWSRRAFIVTMGPDEFFHQPEAPSASNTSNVAYNGRPFLGHDNEFEDNRRAFLAAQERRRTATTGAVVDEPV